MTARGHFDLPKETREAIGDLEELASPMKAWISERPWDHGDRRRWLSQSGRGDVPYLVILFRCYSEPPN